MHIDVVMNYVECDLDESLTLPQWRLMRGGARPRRRHPVRRLIRVGRRTAVRV